MNNGLCITYKFFVYGFYGLVVRGFFQLFGSRRPQLVQFALVAQLKAGKFGFDFIRACRLDKLQILRLIIYLLILFFVAVLPVASRRE